MKKVILILLLSCVAARANAQFTSVSNQCHWRINKTSTAMQHIHLDLIPRSTFFFATLTGPVVFDFAVKQFKISGTTYLTGLEGITNVVWDATGSDTAPPMVGDPNNLKTYTGHLTLDPTIHTRWFTTHGWWAPLFSVITYFNSGDTMINELIPSFFSNLVPTDPISTAGIPSIESSCSPISAATQINWGNNFVMTMAPNYLIPAAPISSNFTINLNTDGYGSQTLPPATFEYRKDLDLHNGIPGTTLKIQTGVGVINTQVVLDPVVFGMGDHKTAFFREQISADGTEEVDTLFVFDTIVTGVTPPQTCQDPLANNVGQPLPCTYTTPPPTSCTITAQGNSVTVSPTTVTKCMVIGVPQ